MKNTIHSIWQIVVFLLLSASLSYAQFHDNHWLMGYYGGEEGEPNDSLGVSILSFTDAQLQIEANESIDLFMQDASVSESDYYGELKFFTNAIEIRNAEDHRILNGKLTNHDNSAAALKAQTVLILPKVREAGNQLYYYFRMYFDEDTDNFGHQLTYSIVDMSYQNGFGQVLEKNTLILQDTLLNGKLTATRHANGRDWWVLAPRMYDNKVYSILVTPEEITVKNIQEVSPIFLRGLGQTVFSPNGEAYALFDLFGFPGDTIPLHLFSFDRCTGLLSNYRTDQVYGGEHSLSGGVAISPNSRYLYVSYYEYLYQYDLWADDLPASKQVVGIYDGYTEWNFFHSRFYLQQLAPDGKIYMNISSGAKVLHVIHDPDQPGELCNFEQHDVHLPMSNAAALANHPNYRLGPLDGSPCDTLGIDNLPRAYYRADRDTSEILSFSFHDLSYYEPANWYWTFGDGGTSTERHPDHEYAMPGIYEVCLTVSNGNGSDTHCRTYNLGVTSTAGRHFGSAFQLKLFPNPATDIFYVDIIDYVPLDAYLILYDALGRPVHQQRLWQRQTAVQVGALPAGVYAYEIREQGQRVGQGKVVLR